MRIRNVAAVLAVVAVSAAVQSQERAPRLSQAHDGRWSVELSCADTRDKNGVVKGYEYRFVVTISGGKLEGRHGAEGEPASVSYSGYVQEDGVLEITAAGNTGKPAYAVGRLAQGSPYSYTMHGKLGAASGEAVRREIRPCTATFAKQQPR